MRLDIRRIRPLVPFVAALLVTGCSLAPPVSPAPPLDRAVTQQTLKSRLTFEPSAEDAASSSAEQASRTLIAFIRIRPAQLRAVLITPYGQRLATLVRDDNGTRFEPGDAPGEPPLPMPPAWLASRLEWSLWPADALAEAFADSDWQIDEGDGHRDILYHGERAARITPAPNQDHSQRLALDDAQGDYRLIITPLSMAPEAAPHSPVEEPAAP